MIDLIKSFFGKDRKAGSGNRPGKRDIEGPVAACALLLEMAHVDGEFDDPERKRIVSILTRDYDLSDEYAEEIMKTAVAEIEGSIDLWRFTHLINENYTIEEKIHLIEMIWKVAFTDSRLDKHEDHLVHRLAELLNLDHKQLIDAKLKVKAKI